jgi:hypothetical protein
MADAAQLPVMRRSVLSYATLLILFSTLIIDGFPAGSALLREFGARLTNFILLLALIVLIIERLTSTSSRGLTRHDVFFVLIVAIGIPAVNLPVTLLQTAMPPAGPLSDWSRQYAMFLWGLASYWIWSRLLRHISPDELAALICFGAILPLIFFFADLTGSDGVHTLLEAVRVKRDERPSGLATEPSLYAAWMAFTWPLVMFYAIRARSYLKRVIGILLWLTLCISGYLSNARTIAVIAVMQIAYFGYWLSRNSRGLNRLRALVILGLCSVGVLAAFAESLTSLTDTDVGSNISRIGSTVTSLRVAIAHPFFGIGIGQLRYFFGAYAPDFALASEEILIHATDLGEYRASSFNLFVRLVCELGFAVGLFFSFLIVRPIISAMRSRDADLFIVFGTLTALGGVGFWLSADQFGYQPAILSLVILSKALSSRSRALDENQT